MKNRNEPANLSPEKRERWLKRQEQAERRRLRRSMFDNAMRDLGLKKARGAFGGVYWE